MGTAACSAVKSCSESWTAQRGNGPWPSWRCESQTRLCISVCSAKYHPRRYWRARTLRRPNNRATLELARVVGAPLDRSRRARQEAYDAELTGVVMVQQRGTEAARGSGGAKCELAVKTRQREARCRNERGAKAVEKHSEPSPTGISERTAS